MRGLVVGRFQPLHHGHVALIRRAVEDCVQLTVAIGSTDQCGTERNPFTYEERERMVRAVFDGGIDVVAVPDIHDPPRWVEHVVERAGRPDKVYGNDRRTLDLFEDAGYPVVAPGLVQRERLEASVVRMQMAEDDPSWLKAVPTPVAQVLEEIEAPRRLRLAGARL